MSHRLIHRFVLLVERARNSSKLDINSIAIDTMLNHYTICNLLVIMMVSEPWDSDGHVRHEHSLVSEEFRVARHDDLE